MTEKTDTKEVKSLNIYQRISCIMEEVRGVNKGDKRVNGQYAFVSHDSVAEIMHDALVRHGVAFIPSVEEMVQEGNRTVAKVKCDFVNVDNPQDRISTWHWGYGVDPQDKGPGKAVSYATKYAMLKTFVLKTGDDVEKDNYDFDPGFLSESEIAYVNDIFGDDLDSKNAVLKYFDVPEVKCLKKSSWDDIIKISAKYVKKQKLGEQT